jgi:hypothetical protein
MADATALTKTREIKANQLEQWKARHEQRHDAASYYHLTRSEALFLYLIAHHRTGTDWVRRFRDELPLMNSFAWDEWQYHLVSAFDSLLGRCGSNISFHAITILDQDWCYSASSGQLNRREIIGQVRDRCPGLNHIMMIEPMLVTNRTRPDGERLVAPRCHGICWGEAEKIGWKDGISQQLNQIKERFNGGIFEAVRHKQIYDLATEVEHFVHPPYRRGYVAIPSKGGACGYRGVCLPPVENYRFWKRIQRYSYPRLTFAGGLEGEELLHCARAVRRELWS